MLCCNHERSFDTPILNSYGVCSAFRSGLRRRFGARRTRVGGGYFQRESNLTTPPQTDISARRGQGVSKDRYFAFRSTPYNYRSVATFSRVDPSTDAPLENP